MKNILLSLTLLICVSTLSSQNLTWAKNMGGTSLDNGLSVAVDASGNVYTVGYFQGTADFDPGAGVSNLTSFGGTDIFISKLNSAGNFVWAKQMGGTNYDYARSVAVSSAGNIYITGYFIGTADFNPAAAIYNLTSAGGDEIFVSKLDASGNFVWAKQMGGTTSDYAYAIALDASENVYTAGAFQNTADFDPSAAVTNLTSSGNFDIYVSKLDLNGNFVWAKNMGSTSQDFALCISLDASSNVYTSGYFQSSADFDPSAATYTLNSVNARDIFISKLDVSGNFVWAKQIGGGGDQIGNAITTGINGVVCLTGSFANTADFDTGTSSYTLASGGGDDIFVTVLNPSGNLLWAKSFGSTGNDYGRGITIDAAYNIYTTGEFNGTVDFDPNAGINNLVALGATDIFVSKLDNTGNFGWAKSIGSSSGSAAGNAITCDATPNIYTTGLFTGTTDFDPNAGVFNLVAPGTQADVFVLKMNSIATAINEASIGVKAVIYPNPTSSMLNIKTDETIETINIINIMGEVVQQETTNTFSVEKLVAGVYFIQLNTKSGLYTTRIVKQ